MSRVEEDREAQRLVEARRIEADQKVKHNEAKVAFGKVVEQQAGLKQQETQKPRLAEQQHAEGARREQHLPSAALMARRGIDARAVNAMLEKHGEKNVAANAERLLSRREELSDKEARRVERLLDSGSEEQRLEREALAAIAGHDEGECDDAGQKSRGGGGMDMGGQAQPGMAELAGTGASAASQQATSLPIEVLRQLVARAFAGVTPEGLHQFTVELKMEVLGGARLDIVSDAGKISCTFHTADKNIGRLVKASAGPLARALSERGLTLERLEVKSG